MASAVISDYSNTVLKTLFSPDAVEIATYKQSPVLGMLSKDENFQSEKFRELVFYGELQGVGKIFSGVQSNIANPSDAAFDLTRAEDYAMASLDGWLIEATEGGSPEAKHAFVAALKRHMDSALRSIGHSMSHGLYRDKFGSRGTATASTTTITLVDKDDIVLFQKGMPLVASATDGGVSLSTTVPTISSIDRAAGTFVTSADMSSAWTGTFYLYRSTDTDATTGAAATGKSISGLRAWLPATVTGTAFFGQDRSLDAQRLAGSRYDGSSKNMRETMVNAVAVADRDDCAFDMMVMRPTEFQKLENELGSNVRYCQDTAQGPKGPQAAVGFRGIVINGPDNGEVHVYKDRWCLKTLAFGLKKDSWKIRSLNKAPHILNKDGLTMLRSATANTYEIRWGASWQLGCNAPGQNIVITLPS